MLSLCVISCAVLLLELATESELLETCLWPQALTELLATESLSRRKQGGRTGAISSIILRSRRYSTNNSAQEFTSARSRITAPRRIHNRRITRESSQHLGWDLGSSASGGKAKGNRHTSSRMSSTFSAWYDLVDNHKGPKTRKVPIQRMMWIMWIMMYFHHVKLPAR